MTHQLGEFARSLPSLHEGRVGAGLDKSQSTFPGVTSTSLWIAVCDTALTHLAGSVRDGEGRAGWSQILFGR